jgi:hypothetical protein
VLDLNPLSLTLAVLSIFLGGWILGVYLTWRIAKWLHRAA